MIACPANDEGLPSGSRRSRWLFWGLLALAMAVRLVGIARPLTGNFATKNVVYAMIARNWAEGRASLWYPTLDCMAGGRRSLHMLEFPVSAYLTAGAWRLMGGSLDVWGRATSVAFSVASVAVLAALVRRKHGARAGLAAGLFLALSPVSVLYGQSFMLEASLVFFTVAAIDCFDRWLSTARGEKRGTGPLFEGAAIRASCRSVKKRACPPFLARGAWLAAGAVCLALALLTKVYMLVLLLPLGAMVYCALRSSARRAAAAAVAIVLAILPAACWYWHAAATAAPGSPYADHVFYSVRQTAEVHLPPHPLLWSPEFYRRVLDDLSGVVLTPVGLAMALAGFLDRGWRRHAAWLLASLLLVAALPLKFYAMNYYYLAVLPPLCVLAGLGWQRVAERLRPGPVARIVLLLVLLLFSCRYWVRPVTVTAEEDRPVLAAAAAVRALTGPDEPVATMHGSTLDLLYYCDRPGWALSPEMPGLADRLADCRRQGARYLVVAGPAAEHLPGTVAWPAPVVQGDGFRVFRDF